jgi:hypothetical protein
LGADALQTINARMNAAVAQQLAGRPVDAETALSKVLDRARTSLGWSAPTTEALRYHLADCRLDQRQTKEVNQLLDGLSAETLNAAQIEADWDGRLLYESDRLALLNGQYDKAVRTLERAAEIIAIKDPDGRISEAYIRRLIADAGQPQPDQTR